METVLKFDKCILAKELNEKFKKTGELFEVANILNDSSFLLRDAKTKVAYGVVSFEDFENHFILEGNFSGWTPWTQFVGFDGQTDVAYRTNRKKVQVKFVTDKVRAESCCHKEDEFNLFWGVQLAYLRCLNKALAKKKVEHENALTTVNANIAENENIIKKMVNSLNA